MFESREVVEMFVAEVSAWTGRYPVVQMLERTVTTDGGQTTEFLFDEINREVSK